MLKTNSKKARQNLQAYIMDNFNGENYGINTPKTFEDAAKIILDNFRNTYLNNFNRRYPEAVNFEDWAAGLPSIIDTCYYYNRSAIEDLGNILEETKEELEKYSQSQAEHILTNLIYRELIRTENK